MQGGLAFNGYKQRLEIAQMSGCDVFGRQIGEKPAAFPHQVKPRTSDCVHVETFSDDAFRTSKSVLLKPSRIFLNGTAMRFSNGAPLRTRPYIARRMFPPTPEEGLASAGRAVVGHVVVHRQLDGVGRRASPEMRNIVRGQVATLNWWLVTLNRFGAS